MPKRHQQRPAKEVHARTNADKSTEITTGTYKKHETYERQARLHENPAATPQPTKVPPKKVIPPDVTTKKQDSRIMMREGERRTGSDSNASSSRKKDKMHEHAEKQPEAKLHTSSVDEFEEDLRPDNFAGANYGPKSENPDTGLRAFDIKELHNKLADLAKDELRSIVIVPVGERLEQGAKYIDLQHLEQGEFVAMADMVATEDSYFVPKSQTDYVLWNRLRQIDNPARLDEPGG